MLLGLLRHPGQPSTAKSTQHNVPRGPRWEPLPYPTLQLRLSLRGCQTRVVPELAGEPVEIRDLSPTPDICSDSVEAWKSEFWQVGNHAPLPGDSHLGTWTPHWEQ